MQPRIKNNNFVVVKRHFSDVLLPTEYEYCGLINPKSKYFIKNHLDLSVITLLVLLNFSNFIMHAFLIYTRSKMPLLAILAF